MNGFFQSVRNSEVHYDPMNSSKNQVLFATVPLRLKNRSAMGSYGAQGKRSKVEFESSLTSEISKLQDQHQDKRPDVVENVEELQLHRKPPLASFQSKTNLKRKTQHLPALAKVIQRSASVNVRRR